MSETTYFKDTMPTKKIPKRERKVTRRQAVFAALFGLGPMIKVAYATEGSCSCLEAPDCSSICTYGGTPKADGSQACDCNEPPVQTLATVAYTGSYSDVLNKPTLAKVATTGNYNDLSGLPTIPSATPDSIITAQRFGPSSNITINRGGTGSIQIPKVTVNKYGLVTGCTSYTLKISTGYNTD